MKIGVICPSEIAFRRFLPALSKVKDFEFAGVAVASREEFQGASDEVLAREREKAQPFIDTYGGEIFEGYKNLIYSDKIDCVYLPLPPGLHYIWAKEALLAGKHILVEKPATTALADTQDLIATAKAKGLAVHENYMFPFHAQIKAIDDIVASGEIGDIRLYRICFGFPLRAANDFRYNKKLGGGALLDCGGYTLKYAAQLLGDSAKIICATSNSIDGFEVDMYGTATLVNEEGLTAQVAFGMNHNYKCELEVWGSKGTLYTNRVLTAPVGLEPDVVVRKGNDEETRKLPADDAFMKSILRFKQCIDDEKTKKDNYEIIIKQSKIIDNFVSLIKK